ncbi:uncharacterized protein LOC125839446 [Solanum verrucosum]|uniref:uncharacterized protein LOC125839446 n=1 Tax=Solanum verrucosum TaxID=315347 RepID=UPI0020D12969|nr:uncharacterized protein LOC125839446 [Solanum verrucosum]
MKNESDIISPRLLDQTDVDDFVEWSLDENVSKFFTWGTFLTKKDAKRYTTKYFVTHPWFRTICLNGKPIGYICVSPHVGSDRFKGEIGYVLSSKYWGKGIATKAVKMVAATIFVEWPHLVRLEGMVNIDNIRSQRVLEKAGFTREGVLRKYYIFKRKLSDLVMFSLLSTDQLT